MRKSKKAGIDAAMMICETMTAMNQPFSEIGDRLRAVREAHNETQKDWAALHGFNYTQYNNWEKGAMRITVQNAERLCDVYGLTLDFIYRGRRDGLSEYARKVLSSHRPM